MDDASHGLRVNVDQLVYQEGVLTPPDTPHCFAYYITILNEGEETITVRGRKWSGDRKQWGSDCGRGGWRG